MVDRQPLLLVVVMEVLEGLVAVAAELLLVDMAVTEESDILVAVAVAVVPVKMDTLVLVEQVTMVAVAVVECTLALSEQEVQEL